MQEQEQGNIGEKIRKIKMAKIVFLYFKGHEWKIKVL